MLACAQKQNPSGTKTIGEVSCNPSSVCVLTSQAEVLKGINQRGTNILMNYSLTIKPLKLEVTTDRDEDCNVTIDEIVCTNMANLKLTLKADWYPAKIGGDT